MSAANLFRVAFLLSRRRRVSATRPRAYMRMCDFTLEPESTWRAPTK